MLDITRDENGYIKVISKLPTWNETQVDTILYDMKNKRKRINNDAWYPMTPSCVEWVNKYYIPKLKEVVNE